MAQPNEEKALAAEEKHDLAIIAEATQRAADTLIKDARLRQLAGIHIAGRAAAVVFACGTIVTVCADDPEELCPARGARNQALAVARGRPGLAADASDIQRACSDQALAAAAKNGAGAAVGKMGRQAVALLTRGGEPRFARQIKMVDAAQTVLVWWGEDPRVFNVCPPGVAEAVAAHDWPAAANLAARAGARWRAADTLAPRILCVLNALG